MTAKQREQCRQLVEECQRVQRDIMAEVVMKSVGDPGIFERYVGSLRHELQSWRKRGVKT